jgi:uncharacterized membrane protein HdeD (DUF308 family)
MTAINPRPDEPALDPREAIRRHWVLFLIQGLIMILLGFVAIGEPMVATIAVALFAGWLFLISGIVGLAGMFTARRAPSLWWTALSSLLGILVGVYLIWRPLAGVLSLTLVAAAYFGSQGVVQIITAVTHRRAIPSWIWMLFGGVVNIVLAALIISGWPGTAEWTLGLLFGINLLVWGMSLTMTALACRTASEPALTMKAAT